jgi:hypothetical protein
MDFWQWSDRVLKPASHHEAVISSPKSPHGLGLLCVWGKAGVKLKLGRP